MLGALGFDYCTVIYPLLDFGVLGVFFSKK